MSGDLDKRLHAYRDDLADEALKGKVKAGKFVRGDRHRVNVPYTDVRPRPDFETGIDTQLLFGDNVRVYDEAAGWAWVQSLRDNYVGYVRAESLARDVAVATHRIYVPRTFAYSAPDMKMPQTDCYSLGTAIVVNDETETRGTKYVRLANGSYVIARHVRKIDDDVGDYVSVAEKLLQTPYLWGGATAFGLDCSGIVQLSMLMAGKKVQRDSDMQAQSIGNELGFSAMDGGLQRGDLVFWKGHVGIMKDAETLIHANGHTMDVAIEPLENAIERIGYLYGFPTTLRRP